MVCYCCTNILITIPYFNVFHLWSYGSIIKHFIDMFKTIPPGFHKQRSSQINWSYCPAEIMPILVAYPPPFDQTNWANSTRNARILFLFCCNHDSGIVPHWYSVQQHDQMPTKTGETARGSKHSTDKRMKSEDQILPILDGNTLWWTNIAIEDGHL